MWPSSNHPQQWSSMPNDTSSSSNSHQQLLMGGGFAGSGGGVGGGSDPNQHAILYQQQRQQIQYGQVQHQLMMPQHQMLQQVAGQQQQQQFMHPQIQLPPSYQNNGDMGSLMNSVALANYSLAPQPPPPPPPPLPPSHPMVLMAPPPPPPPPPRPPPLPPPPPPNQQQYYCTLCRVACPNEVSFGLHINSARHQKNQANFTVNKNDAHSGLEPPPPSKFVYCEICNVTCPNKSAYDAHLIGAKHRKMVAASSSGRHPTAKKEPTRKNNANNNSARSGIVHCNICNISCPNALSYEQHLAGTKHQKKVATANNGEVVVAPATLNDAHSKPNRRDTKVEKGVNNVYENALQSLLNFGKKAPIAKDPRVANHTLVDAVKEEPLSNGLMGPITNAEDDSDEEGEIDEVKEDIDILYDDFAEPSSTSSGNTLTKREEANEHDAGEAIIDSDVNEFLKEETNDNDPDVDDMFGDEDHESETSIENVVGKKGEHDYNEQDDDDSFSSSSVVATDRFSHLKYSSIDVAVRIRTPQQSADTEYCGDHDVMDMFGENDEPTVDSSSRDERSVFMQNLVVDELETKIGGTEPPQIEVLDSGLGFVLDYSPDTSTTSGVGFVRNQEPLHALVQEGSKPSDKLGFSSKDVLVEEKNASKQAQYITGDEKLDSAVPRAKVPITPMSPKREPVKLPDRIPQFDVSSKETYYPIVHPDKYWSDMRSWDFVKDLNDAMKSEGAASIKKEAGTKRSLELGGKKDTGDGEKNNGDSLPDAFESVAQYKALWAPLLIKEAKAQLLSEVVAAQASPSTSWIRGTKLALGAIAKLELSRDPSIDDSRTNSSDPTVVLRIRASTGIGCQVCANDLLLFVHQGSIVERALQGKAFEAISYNSVGNLQEGRLGFVGHTLKQRMLVRVSKKYWSQFAKLDEMIVIHIGSNITALREFNALSRVDTIPLVNYLLDGKKTNPKCDTSSPDNDRPEKASAKFCPLATEGNSLPIGFRIFIKAKLNESQQNAITASASEYGDGGFTLIKGPPGTGKTSTLVSLMNAIHLRQYQAYYSAIENIVAGSFRKKSEASAFYEELAALNRAVEMKPRILVCAPSNAGIDNVILKIMSDKFVDGQGGKYAPSIVRVGAGVTHPKIESVGLKHAVDTIIMQSSDPTKLENYIATQRQNLKRCQTEIHNLRTRIQAMVESCPYKISSDWEIRVDEASFESSGRVLFVNHSTKATTFDIPPKVRPNETPANIHQMPHYRSLLKSLTKYVERHNNETSNLEKYIILQNAAKAKLEAGAAEVSDDSLLSQLEAHVLNSSHIVLTTLGSAGGRAMKSAHRFKVVVIDEAAQSAEPSTLVALQLGSKHAILVGDPQQLPATIFSVSGRSTKYDRSLFQRLEEAGHDVHLLNVQYRMAPLISEFPRHIFYQNELVDGPNVQQSDFGGTLKTILRVKCPYMQPFNIFDLDSKEKRDGTSLSNRYEAQLALQLYCTLDRESDGLLSKTRVAVITPYSQQAGLLRQLFEEKYGASYPSRVEISTVDAFQGREADVVIYSCVRAGGSGSGIGFLSDVQRMNVALTRARHFLFIIARRRTIMVNPYWRMLVGYARRKSAIIPIPLLAPQNTVDDHGLEQFKRQIKPTLRSSLIKSFSTTKRKVTFGGVDERLYQVDSSISSVGNNTIPTKLEDNSLFPDLTRLSPMHKMMLQEEHAESDSECSA